MKSDKNKVVKELKKKWEQWNSQLKDRIFPTLGNDIGGPLKNDMR